MSVRRPPLGKVSPQGFPHAATLQYVFRAPLRAPARRGNKSVRAQDPQTRVQTHTQCKRSTRTRCSNGSSPSPPPRLLLASFFLSLSHALTQRLLLAAFLCLMRACLPKQDVTSLLLAAAGDEVGAGALATSAHAQTAR